MTLLKYITRSCYYAQEHFLSDTCTLQKEELRLAMEATSYQVSCFIAQNTAFGYHGVDWDIVLDELVSDLKTESEWKKIIVTKVRLYGGWVRKK